MKSHSVQKAHRSLEDQHNWHGWKEKICSKSNGTRSQKLADEIATFARCLATNIIPHVTYQHHHCSGNTTNMCQTGIRHRSSNTRCKQKLQRWKKWMLIVSWCCYMYLHCLELLRQAHETGTQPATRDIPHWVHSITRLRYHYIGIS